MLAVVVSPFRTGNLATMPWVGVFWNLPPNGMSTVLAPTVLSKRSAKPCWERSAGAFTRASCCWLAPFVFKKSRLISTIVSPFQFITSRFVSVTSATTVHSKFSSSQYDLNASTSEAAMTQAMRSCDSEMANSVPSRPAYFLGTKSRLIDKPSVNSPMATDTPPAPKSLQRLISVVTSPRRNKR